MSNVVSAEVLEWRRKGKRVADTFATFLNSDTLLALIQAAAQRTFTNFLQEGAPANSALGFLSASRELKEGYVVYSFGNSERPYVTLCVSDAESEFAKIHENDGLQVPPENVSNHDDWAKDRFFDYLGGRFEEVNIYGEFVAHLFNELMTRYTFMQLGIDESKDRILALFHDELDDVDLSFQCEIDRTFAPEPTPP